MIRLGMHSFTEQIPFTHGTPSVEASWAFNAYPGLGLRESVERVLAQKRRGVRPILRIDYAPGQVCPPNEVGLPRLPDRSRRRSGRISGDARN